MSYCPVYMKTPSKIIISFLVRSRKKKKKKMAKSVITNYTKLHQMRKLGKIYSKVLKQKLFESMCNLLDAFGRTSFYLL
jgi:hypothetical protein